MRPLFALYAVSALVLAGAAGPIMQSTRDGALTDLTALSQPRPLSEFGFLKAARPYLPPIVVDWIVYEKGSGADLPPGADIHIDRDGTLIVTWPDGCSETYKDGQRSPGSACGGEDPPPVCGTGRDSDEACAAECTEDERFDADAGSCVSLDPCASEDSSEDDGGGDGDEGTTNRDDGPGDAGSGCPPPPPPCAPEDDGREQDNISADQTAGETQEGCPEDPPLPPCDEGHARARDGECWPLGEIHHLNESVTGASGVWSWDLTLPLPNDAFWLEIERSDRPGVSYEVTLTHEGRTAVCWRQAQEAGADDPCTVRLPATQGSTAKQRFDANISAWLDDAASRGLVGNLTLQVTANAIAGEATGNAPFRPLAIQAYGHQIAFPDATDPASGDEGDGSADGSPEG